jgi:predicted nucleic acid-binding protein
MPFERNEEVIQAISAADEIAQEDLRQSPLAATALNHGLRMVTRNERDFVFQGLDVVNPWEPGGIHEGDEK